eukprot:TRINITY_DN121321_c0_g1_i1.p1 TRINITY_DN121321_c0_g1~~TRINITY_DN121321_c0_g1_i1.p1  ORF type:complete len:1389 (-),score=277.89 TRINITY_DN121321_c0_g1_i1:75-4154(-)
MPPERAGLSAEQRGQSLQSPRDIADWSTSRSRAVSSRFGTVQERTETDSHSGSSARASQRTVWMEMSESHSSSSASHPRVEEADVPLRVMATATSQNTTSSRAGERTQSLRVPERRSERNVSFESENGRDERSSSFGSLREIVLQMLDPSIAGSPAEHGANRPQTRGGRYRRARLFLRFLMVSSIYLLNLVLRMVCLAIYACHLQFGVMAAQISLEVIGALLSLQVAMQDADVQRWMSPGTAWPIRVVTSLLSCLLLGCCQVIHVKRAWARRLHAAEVLRESDGRDFLWSGPASGAERALPVALITGVPFALINSYAYLRINHFDQWPTEGDLGGPSGLVHALHSGREWFNSHKDFESFLLACGSLSALLIVSLAIVDVDIGVSGFVSARYHFDPRRRGSRLGRLQFLYPFGHGTFRAAEVVLRAAVITQIVVVLELTDGNRGLICALAIVASDFAAGVALLRWQSPPEEKLSIHCLVGVGLLLANVARFVDRPGFRRPARLVSLAVEALRAVELLVLVAFWATAELWKPELRLFEWEDQAAQRRRVSFFLVMISSALVYYYFGCTPVARKRGADLHSVVDRGDLRGIRKLLDMGRGGEALDANAVTKDSAMETPLMLAAARGDVEVLRLLLGAGARVPLRDSSGCTCLHHAARFLQLEAFSLLAAQRGGREVIRAQRRSLAEEVRRARPWIGAGRGCFGRRRNQRRGDRGYGHDASSLDLEARRQQLMECLGADGRSLVASLASLAPAAPEGDALRSVRARLATARHLRDFFPDAMEEDTAPMHELRSVSALVLATAVGPLARSLLPPAPISTLLGQLRRVRKLGTGACGEVIEVEVIEEERRFRSMSASSVAGGSYLGSPVPGGSMLQGRQRGNLASTLSSFVRVASATFLSGSGETSAPSARRYAMKLQAKAQSRSELFACSEVVALRRAYHPFIVKIEEAFQTPHFFVLLLELCPGGDLNKLLCSQEDDDGCCRGLPVERVAKYGGQILLALRHLHEAVGIVYRDVKPENILLSGRDEAKLADFGLALYVGKDARSVPLDVAGTSGFMAPELALGNCGNSTSSSFAAVEHEVDAFQQQLRGAPESFSGRSSAGSSVGSVLLDDIGVSADTDGGHAGFAVEPFKTDAYSFGVTLLLMLLGEEAGERILTEESEQTLNSSIPELASSTVGLRLQREWSGSRRCSTESIPEADSEREAAERGSAVLMPLPGSEDDRKALLDRAVDSGRLSPDARQLLLSLLPHRPAARLRLGDASVQRHPFFLKALGCESLEQHLLPTWGAFTPQARSSFWSPPQGPQEPGYFPSSPSYGHYASNYTSNLGASGGVPGGSMSSTSLLWPSPSVSAAPSPKQPRSGFFS